jgi:hypothetical protein
MSDYAIKQAFFEREFDELLKTNVIITEDPNEEPSSLGANYNTNRSHFEGSVLSVGAYSDYYVEIGVGGGIDMLHLIYLTKGKKASHIEYTAQKHIERDNSYLFRVDNLPRFSLKEDISDYIHDLIRKNRSRIQRYCFNDRHFNHSIKNYTKLALAMGNLKPVFKKIYQVTNIIQCDINAERFDALLPSNINHSYTQNPELVAIVAYLNEALGAKRLSLTTSDRYAILLGFLRLKCAEAKLRVSRDTLYAIFVSKQYHMLKFKQYEINYDRELNKLVKDFLNLFDWKKLTTDQLYQELLDRTTAYSESHKV